MSNAKQNIARWIDSHFPAQVGMLKKLVQMPSDNPPGDCTPHALMTAQLLQDLDLQVEILPVPDEIVQAAGMRSATNLIVRHCFGPGPVVALNAHGDVVPPGGGWSKDPYGAEIEDGWLYGRGAAVSKSDITTYTSALLALKHSGATLNGTIELHITYDEETGGHTGPGWLLDNGITKPDYVVCAALSYFVVTAHNGCLHLEIAIEGKSAHAAFPGSGCDAIEAGNRLMTALYQYRDSLAAQHSAVDGIDSPTLVIGLVQGGINTNVVSDNMVIRLDRRIIPEENPEAVERELMAIIAGVQQQLTGISFNLRQILLARPFTPSAQSLALAKIFSDEAEQVLQQPIPLVGLPLYTDARLYSAAGIPTIMYGAGPRSFLEANGHRADERVHLDDLRHATQIVANSLLTLLQEKSA
ncbi:acetylornithine deacetylase/succinyl-diaminopimelate desuccinylase-like protein [Erwinia toletana]|uniref:Acetylornithine deacetylase/succinyl-diaminopimelate desuccinylase-like protein n=1 Tax=Winslowiella toletana TaxID=92490 RepID=A0ABS4PBX1_9GAMM|nr:M20/M25/M40 family metallo-hydrolase [Winslowiella toletana]MBP2169571.1 acetylornithine deacetylase/succinyl-diaminopimelate desuccinylase-like protein [Winslowiella toletana]